MKSFGQHFLKNQLAIKKIIAALDLQEKDTVVEIGPGHGELTSELIKHPIEIIAIEKDQRLAKELELRIRNQELWKSRAKIINDDVLKVLKSPDSKFLIHNSKIVGNIPYYITGYLLRILSELENKPSLTVLTVQKEVAERIVAKPPEMNRLAAITQFWAETKILAILPAKDFDPPPEVDSAVIVLKTRSSSSISDRELMRKYYKTVKILFQQPRKTVLNNLTAGLKILKDKALEKMRSLGLTGEERPQNLGIDQIKKLSEFGN